LQNDKDEVLTSLITEAKPSFINPSQFYGNENGGFDCSFEDLDMRMELVESCIFLKESSRNKKETSLNFEKSSVQPECKRIKNSATESSVRNIYSLNTDSKFPYIEIRISDVLNDDGNQITRRIKIADSSFLSNNFISSDGNRYSQKEIVRDKNVQIQFNSKILWCGGSRNRSGYSRTFGKLEMPRDAYNKLVVYSVCKYVVRKTGEPSYYDVFPGEVFAGEKLLIPSIADAVKFALYGQAFEEIGQSLWYWGGCTMDNGSNMLRHKKTGSFIVRNSRQNSCPVTLSIRVNKGINSIRIRFTASNAENFPSDACCFLHGAMQSNLFSLVKSVLSHSDKLEEASSAHSNGDLKTTASSSGSSSSILDKCDSEFCCDSEKKASFPIKIYHRASLKHLCRLALNNEHKTWKNLENSKTMSLLMNKETLEYLHKYPYPI